MAKLSITTHLATDKDTVIRHVMTPRLLDYITKGILLFEPIDPPSFPETWSPGQYKAKMLWKGVLPVGWQVIGIELPPPEGETFLLRDNGHGGLIRVWDHMIELTPTENGTRYTDRLEIKAGLLTPLIWVFAQLFYRHRQRRWRRLIANEFDYTL